MYSESEKECESCWACIINSTKNENECGVCRRVLQQYTQVLLTLKLDGTNCTVVNMAGTIVSAFDCKNMSLGIIRTRIATDSKIDFNNIIITNPEIIDNINICKITNGSYKNLLGKIVSRTKLMVYVALSPNFSKIVRVRQTNIEIEN